MPDSAPLIRLSSIRTSSKSQAEPENAEIAYIPTTTVPVSDPNVANSLIKLHDADPRTDKIDLGVGVYKDEHGKTPVLRAVRAAEQAVLEANEELTPRIISMAQEKNKAPAPATSWAARTASGRLKSSGTAALELFMHCSG